MEIKRNVEVQSFTTTEDLECGTVFVFCDDNEPMLKGCDYEDTTYVIRLSDGAVYGVYGWESRPVRQIKAVLTVE